MCVAMPGKVIELKEKTAVVDFDGNKVEARSGLVKLNVGDYCLVHAGIVIQTLKPEEAEEMIGFMKEAEDSLGE